MRFLTIREIQLIPLLIAETIYEGAYISSALTALHQQCDKHGRAYLATNLPANQVFLFFLFCFAFFF